MTKKHTFIRHCKDCGKIFNPSGKFNYFCKDCLKVRECLRNKKVRKTYSIIFPKRKK